jgi:diguanylate cyclase (GGDEF)-like protein/PAS domain S-box-containing protein
MKRFITPTLQISIGLLSLTISLIFIAYSFGFLPNEEKAALEARAKISEALAVQLANLAGRNDGDAIKDTIDAVVGRNDDVLSIAVRGANGKLLVASRDHSSRWAEPADGKSTPTQVQVPLLNGDAPAGKIEIVFRPMATGETIFGLPTTMIGFVGFIGIAGFTGYFLILRRALWELDPSRAIPERVKAAFDTLAEGVLIMDEREFVLLANEAFVKNIYKSSKSLLGVNAVALPWAPSGDAAAAGEFPWRTAMRTEQSVLGIPMAIRNPSGDSRRLLVNATRIVDGKGIARGAIATFDDVTVLHQTNEQLNISIQQLYISQARISEQNKQLQFLASSDPLTGCLNRRTFFEQAERALQGALGLRQPMTFFMVDADHFKRINDRFGHVVGDKVLIGLADLLRRFCSDQDLVGRYGGEEFCVAAAGMSGREAERLAERILLAVADIATWLPNGERVTISIGLASLGSAPCDIADLVKRADEALYVAKTTGRNRFVRWEGMRPPIEASKPRQFAGLAPGA